MPTKQQKRALRALLAYYDVLAEDDEYDWVRWTNTPRNMSKKEANAFLLGVMLDQGQPAERAWDKGDHLARKQFKGDGGFWQVIRDTKAKHVHRICRTGYY